uniref:Uncharacterized protein n=1 Tax=Strongyloides venezuelensis TaxID=75913 RepID=A0A0K0F0V2_STRVS
MIPFTKYTYLFLLIIIFISIIDGKSLLKRVPYKTEADQVQTVIYKNLEYGMRFKYVTILVIVGGFFMSCALICLCCTCLLCISILQVSCCYPNIHDDESNNMNDEDEEDIDIDSKKNKQKHHQ